MVLYQVKRDAQELAAIPMKVLEGLSSEASFGLFRLNALVLSTDSEQDVSVREKFEFHVNDTLFVLLYPAAQYSKTTTKSLRQW